MHISGPLLCEKAIQCCVVLSVGLAIFDDLECNEGTDSQTTVIPT